VTTNQDSVIGDFLADVAESGKKSLIFFLILGGALVLLPLIATVSFALRGRWESISPLEPVDVPSVLENQNLGKILVPNHPLLKYEC
jgi:hypothetical protein